jgi:hypothetical protein
VVSFRPRRFSILQQLAEAQPDSVIILSLCDLDAEVGARGKIVDAAAGIQNDDDITLQIRLLQARALREQGVREAALSAYKDALRLRSATRSFSTKLATSAASFSSR